MGASAVAGTKSSPAHWRRSGSVRTRAGERRAWRALLEGCAADRTRACLDRVVGIVGNTFGTLATGDLGEGVAGVALLPAYLPADSAARLPEAAFLLDQALSRPASPFPPGFLDGSVGVAWVLEHLRRRIDVRARQDPNRETDTAVGGLLGHRMWEGRYELASGLVGTGVYFLERFPRGTSARALRALVRRLETEAATKSGAIAWLTPSASTRDPQGLRQGCYDFTLPHGIPGVVLFLAGVLRCGVSTARASRLLAGAVERILRERNDEPGECTFPLTVTPEGQRQRSMLAWCQGDLALALCLWQCGVTAGVPVWQQAGLEAAARVSRVMPDSRSSHGIGLCHGTAGIAHLFNCLYQATHLEALAEASRCWFEATVRYVDSESQRPMPPGFLTGWTGVALALSAALSDDPPQWDRALLLSLPDWSPRSREGSVRATPEPVAPVAGEAQ